MEQQVTDTDFEFLAKVSALQHALIVSSTCPVTVWKGEEGGIGRGYLLAMYYDCTEDEKKGLQVMEKRIRAAREDILGHFRLHKSALEGFLDMDGAIITNDRTSFADSCNMVCEKVKEYAELIERHETRLRGGRFLRYPSCPPGHYFHIWHGNRVKELRFNPNETHSGTLTNLDSIQRELTDFKIRQEKLPYISMPFAPDEGAGLYNSSFRQNLSTTQLLLKRAGLDVVS